MRAPILLGEHDGERPLITLMLAFRHELGLSLGQIQRLEHLRTPFQREAIPRDAELRLAEMDFRALLEADPVDLASG